MAQAAFISFFNICVNFFRPSVRIIIVSTVLPIWGYTEAFSFIPVYLASRYLQDMSESSIAIISVY